MLASQFLMISGDLYSEQLSGWRQKGFWQALISLFRVEKLKNISYTSWIVEFTSMRDTGETFPRQTH